jgi:hypothetical protein
VRTSATVVVSTLSGDDLILSEGEERVATMLRESAAVRRA